jgi:hypothetical protein
MRGEVEVEVVRDVVRKSGGGELTRKEGDQQRAKAAISR